MRKRISNRWTAAATLVFACILTAVGCTPKHLLPARPGRRPTRQATRTVTPAQLDRAIRLATGYLVRSCLPSGRFVYLRQADAKPVPTKSYNMLRHAGAVYALTCAYARTPTEEVRRAMVRAAAWLREEHIRPVPGEKNMLALWSPDNERTRADRGKPALAKLGGAGLALVALARVEQSVPGSVSRADLRSLARFLVRMQKPTGSFYSKYYVGIGPDDRWVSLYYPGEAMLGLLALHDLDADPRWLGAAARGMGYLVHSRAARSSLPPDHWALLATAKLLTKWSRLSEPPVSREAVIHHAERICRQIATRQVRSAHDPLLTGALVRDGRTCPTATRLEGIQAVIPFLPAASKGLRTRLEETARAGVAFLVRSQLTTGDCRGGFPYAIRKLPDEPRHRRFNARVRTVRIDYVQHALCALLEYETGVLANAASRTVTRPPASRRDGKRRRPPR